MPKCLLCEREFSQEEIDQGVRVEHATSGRVLLTRFSSGTLHQFDIQKRKSKTSTPRGAFVMAKPVVTPPTPEPLEAPPEAVSDPSVEELAASQVEHFEGPNEIFVGNHEPYNAEPDIEPPVATDTRRHDPRNADEEIGNVLEGIVVGYTPYPNDRGAGFIRLLKYDRARSGLFFTTDNIVVGNLIGLGVRVKCLVCKPEPGKRSLVAKQIEVLELEPKMIKASSKTKIYERETDEGQEE